MNIQIRGQWCIDGPSIYIYLFNVPSFSSRHFNKIKRTSRLGRLLALSLEILYYTIMAYKTNSSGLNEALVWEISLYMELKKDAIPY